MRSELRAIVPLAWGLDRWEHWVVDTGHVLQEFALISYVEFAIEQNQLTFDMIDDPDIMTSPSTCAK